MLIPKTEAASFVPAELPKVRPICLLNEIGKIFERVLVSRMKILMNNTPELNLETDGIIAQ